MADDPILFFAVGLGFGCVIFWQGFHWMKVKKLIEDTPTSKIRSLAIGFCEIYGMVVAIKKTKLVAPFSGSDCVYYRAKVEQYEKRGKSSSWRTISDQIESIKFLIADDTGAVGIDVKGSEIDIPEAFKVESGAFSSPAANLSEYMQTKGLSTKTFIFNNQLKFTEWNIKPGENIYVLGSAGKNPDVSFSSNNSENILIQKGKNEPIFYVSDKPEKQVLDGLFWKTYGCLFGGVILIVGCLTYFFFRFHIL